MTASATLGLELGGRPVTQSGSAAGKGATPARRRRRSRESEQSNRRRISKGPRSRRDLPGRPDPQPSERGGPLP